MDDNEWLEDQVALYDDPGSSDSLDINIGNFNFIGIITAKIMIITI